NYSVVFMSYYFFFQAEDGIRDRNVTGVQTCALPISPTSPRPPERSTFVARSCAFTSAAVMPSAISRSGCSDTRISRSAPPARFKIGRASCREREEVREGGVGVN